MSLISEFTAWIYRIFTSSATTNNPEDTSAPTDETLECRFRLDDDSSATFTLPDGRKLGYAQYGTLKGRPIIYCHGLPGSRIEAAILDSHAQELNARIIAVERPGMGWSSPHPDRTLLDHAKDIERLADHLELQEYGVMGVSGGGPYALACASALPPSKLKSVLIICGLGPPDIGTRGMNIMHRVAFSFGWRIVPTAIVRWYFGREPAGRLDLSDAERLSRLLEQNKRLTHPKDIEILTDVDILKLQLRGLREAYSQGVHGTRQDGKLMSSDWGFRIEDIRPDLPFQLWYGKDDNFVPLNHGKQIAARLGDRAQLRVEDDTHTSIYFRWRREALEGLLASM